MGTMVRREVLIGAAAGAVGIAVSGAFPVAVLAQVDPVSAALVLKDLLSTLEASVQRVIGAADTALANRLSEVDNRIRGLLGEVQKVIDQATTNANDVIANVTAATHETMAALRADFTQAERTAYLDLNDTLANVSRMLSALPLVDVDPYVVGVQPLRMRADATDREVFLYGWFPDVSDGRPAKVEISGARYDTKVYAANRLGFTLPKDVVVPESFVDLTLVLPPHGMLRRFFGVSSKVHDRIYVSAINPHAVSIMAHVVNTDAWPTLASEQPYKEYANTMGGEGRQNVNSMVLAPQMFRQTNPKAVLSGQYDPDTAEFVSMGAPRMDAGGTDGGAPGCSMSEQTKASVRLTCHAPPVPPHWVEKNIFEQWLNGGGGTHAEIYVSPQYRVKRVDLPETVSVAIPGQAMATRSSFEAALPKDWVSVDIVNVFKDGDEHWREIISLNRKNLGGSRLGWKAEIHDASQLVVQTFV